MKREIILFVILGLLISCTGNDGTMDIPYLPKIVVEGRIENGGYASVLLSISAPITGTQDTISLSQYAIRSAKITVSNGDTSEVLYLRLNQSKIPPYEYIGREIIGEVGKTYSLTVESRDNIITASTYIPEPVSLDDIWFRRRSESDTIGYIGVSFKNTSADFYQFSTSLYSQRNTFTPCLYGNIDSRAHPQNEQLEINLNKGPSIYPENNFSTYYNVSDTIRVKFSTQPKHAYDFWVSFQDEIINGKNPLYPAFSNLKSNILGGIGIWSGYGTTQRVVILNEIEK